MTARELRARYESGLWMLPAHMIYGVQRYIEDGVRPSGFLFELLRFGPDDEKPWAYAARMNSFSKREWHLFFSDHMPPDAWGSELKVSAWMAMGGLHGMGG